MLGVVAVTWRRRALVLGGGAAFAAALGAAASAPSFWVLLVAFSVLYPASGAFVSLSQASLMDLDPDRREQNMARWTVAGSLGAVTGPLLLVTFALVGVGWRGILAGLALLALGLVFLVHRAPEPSQTAEERPRLRDAVQAIRSREVFRWLFLLELSDLLLQARERQRHPPKLVLQTRYGTPTLRFSSAAGLKAEEGPVGAEGLGPQAFGAILKGLESILDLPQSSLQAMRPACERFLFRA